MTELWKVPSDWRWSTMGEVAEIIGGGTPRTERADYYGGEIPWITPADLSGYRNKLIGRGARSITKAGLENSGARLMPAGTVLFSSRAPIGYVAVAANAVATNQGFKSFVLRDGVTSDYVYYYLQHAKKLAVELASGTTFLEISGKKAAQIPIPIAPLDEQREIVAEIEKQFTRLEAGVTGLQRVQANLKRYRAAVLKAACEGKLVPTEACLRQAEHGRQAELARQEGRALPAPRPGVFFVYAIRCDNDSIYIGQTQDLQKRWKDHLAGQAADWTGQHKPVLIVHYEEYSSREEAVAREKWLKTGFGRKWLRRETAAGRLPADQVGARQAGYETGAQLLARILTERRQKWNGRGKYKEPVKPNTANLLPLPEGWAWTTMDAVIISGPQNGIYLPKASYGRGCPILRIDDFQEGWVRGRDELNKVTGDPETLKVYQLRVGDLIINRVNSPSHLGKCLVVRASLVPAVFESNMMRAALSGLIHARYIEFYLRSVDGRSRLNSNAKWAVNQASINQQDVKSTGLPLPPFPEQQRIVAEVERRLSVVEELEAVAGANVQRVTRLRQSILQQAFNGSLVCAGLTNSKTGVIENPRVQA